MKNFIRHVAFILVVSNLISCDDLEPIDENRLEFDDIRNVPERAEGILLNAYDDLVDQYSFTGVATDDAVHNDLGNGLKRMALGELTAQFNPTSRWNSFEKVFFANRFLEIVNAGEINWSQDPITNNLFNDRLKGEALALRGLHHYYALQAHAGIDVSGDLSGIPYYSEFIETDGDFNVPRLSFEASVAAIMADFDEALTLLPSIYSDNVSDIDERYADIDPDIYKIVNGAQNDQRISGRIVKGLKARLALFAASPSFLNGQDGYYSIAANNSSEVLNTIGGVSGLAADGDEYYDSDSDIDSGEMLWRGSIENPNSFRERANFPPSVNGDGDVNPSHNLVMAFPMRSGFPATVENGFDPQNPYENRDPRLRKYIVVNGDSFGGSTINTGVGGGIDRLDSISESSTVTGYYLKKLLRPDVRLNDDNTTADQRHYDVYFRFTELFLIFAEAANEMGGPEMSINGMTPREVIAAIRERAGISQPDDFLASVNSMGEMRDLIRNERRLELSFEGHRFWDLRRWGLPLNETVTGYFFNGDDYVLLPAVEPRNYPSFATYLPIPNNEVIKFPALEQNMGW
ncbi:MAG: RagB/SusD family nutrient uptake outer membrane protein [Leeuwenhoekiella sp.]